jgi:hypothetical protein
MKNLYESGRSGRAIGNALMQLEKDIYKLIGAKDFFYTLTRKYNNKYGIIFGVPELNITKEFESRDPDLLGQELISWLQDVSKKSKEGANEQNNEK